jgi:DNA repair protein RadA/Sms
VTKDGSIAGPRALEHIVDVVLQFEGERSSRLRVLRAVKNRFGPVDELGCFDLLDDGIVEVADASGLFISRHRAAMSGTCVTVTLEGRRPLMAEVQSLVVRREGPHPRRAVSGLDSSRLAMLIAVLQRRAGLDLGPYDVYAATVGGALLRGPAADLAMAVSLASAALDRVVATGTIIIGEVGLAGDLRRVPNLSQRLSEAARLGFTHAVVPADNGSAPPAPTTPAGMTVTECADVRSALATLKLISTVIKAKPVDLQVVR